MADTTRIIRASKIAKAGIKITEQSISIVGDERNLINVDDRGITLKGPISIVADGANIRRGGLFVGLPDFLQMIPSTMFTPLPQQVPFPPIAGLVNIGKDVAFFASLLV